MSNNILSAYNLDRNSQEEIARFTNYLRRRGRISSLLPYNLLILADDPDELESFIEDFSRYTFEQGNARKHRVCICTEDELFRHKATLPQWLRNTHACFIMADGKHPASEWLLLEKNLTALPGIVFALCATNRDADERFKQTEQIYNRTFSYHISLGTSTPDTIHLRLLSELTAQGYGQTDAFKEKLHRYIEKIYPESSLKNITFIQDLIRRLINNHISTDDDLGMIGAGAVPPLPGEVRKPVKEKILPEEENSEASSLRSLTDFPADESGFVSNASLSEGISELTRWGRVDALESFLHTNPCEGAGKLMEALKLISDGIQFADAGRFEKGLSLLASALKPSEEETSGNNSEGVSEEAAADESFRLLTAAAQESFAPLLGSGVSAAERIAWCSQKGYYPLALALIESRMPDEMHKLGLFSYPEDTLGSYAEAHCGSFSKDFFIYSRSIPHALQKILLTSKQQEYENKLFSFLKTRMIEKAWEGRRLSKEAVSLGKVLKFRDLEENRTFPLTLSGTAASRSFAFFLLHAALCQIRNLSNYRFDEQTELSSDLIKNSIASYLDWFQKLKSDHMAAL
ncbi:MAG: hypothetical protein K6E30_11475 [Lachnospiraceae bacterium]|nr:hypothetical protein [Lachnospiraceae bacterium]